MWGVWFGLDANYSNTQSVRPRPESEEEEVIDLASGSEEEDNGVISGIFRRHIQPKLNDKTSQKWLDETMGGLNVLKKAVKKGKAPISHSPSPKKSPRKSPKKNSELSPSDLCHAINREKQRLQMNKLAKKEQKARKKSFEKETKRRSKQVIKELRRLSLPLVPRWPSSTLQPRTPVPRTGSVTLDQLREGLRCTVQENTSYFSFNGQPNLSAGAWPDTLSKSQTKRAYKRNLNG